MKKDFIKDFNQIKDMCSKIRTLNESMSFDDDYNDDSYDDYEDEEMPQQVEPKDEEDAEVEAELQEDGSPINAIREIALKGMVKLCKTPDDPQYEVLKKVFTMIDKANDKKNEEQQ